MAHNAQMDILYQAQERMVLVEVTEVVSTLLPATRARVVTMVRPQVRLTGLWTSGRLYILVAVAQEVGIRLGAPAAAPLRSMQILSPTLEPFLRLAPRLSAGRAVKVAAGLYILTSQVLLRTQERSPPGAVKTAAAELEA